jgi:regulatory protein
MDSKLLHQMARFCAYQERCTQDLHRKMQELDIPTDEYPTYIDWLIENNYFNEKRFAEIFARSKFNQKQWGRNKIKFELKKKQIAADLIQVGLKEIDEEEYDKCLQKQIEIAKKKYLKGEVWQQKQKILHYLQSKGFELDLILLYI